MEAIKLQKCEVCYYDFNDSVASHELHIMIKNELFGLATYYIKNLSCSNFDP